MTAQRPDDIAEAYLLEPAVTGPGQQAEFEDFARIYRQAGDLWERGQPATGADRERLETELRTLSPLMNVDAPAITLSEWIPYDVIVSEPLSRAEYAAGPSYARIALVVSEEIRMADNDGRLSRSYAGYLDHWRALYPVGLRVVNVPGSHMEMARNLESLSIVTSMIRYDTGEGSKP